MRQRARVDATQSAIVQALRQVGATVQDLSRVGGGCADLLVARPMPCPCCGAHYPRNVLLEVKTERGTLNALQVDFHATWRGPVFVVRNVDDALKAVGVE